DILIQIEVQLVISNLPGGDVHRNSWSPLRGDEWRALDGSLLLLSGKPASSSSPCGRERSWAATHCGGALSSIGMAIDDRRPLRGHQTPAIPSTPVDVRVAAVNSERLRIEPSSHPGSTGDDRGVVVQSHASVHTIDRFEDQSLRADDLHEDGPRDLGARHHVD